MELHERAARALENNRRLSRVPQAVVEDVLRLGIAWLADHVPASTLASELDSIELDACEACGVLVDREADDGHTVDADGIVLCNACAVETDPELPDQPLPEEER